MNNYRRRLVEFAAISPAFAIPGVLASNEKTVVVTRRLVIDDFQNDATRDAFGASWRGFTDRVMGGVSDGELQMGVINGRLCARLTGRVTRENGGGFVQMAMSFDGGQAEIDASEYKGIELLVYGNDEDYNAHIRTADAGWHDESYRATFHADSRWQRIQLPWEAFQPNRVPMPMDTSRHTRIGLLGWMRGFEADLAVGEIALYA